MSTMLNTKLDINNIVNDNTIDASKLKSDTLKTINGETLLGNGNIELSFSSMVNTTYSELKSLRDNGKLIPGMQYRITDYITTTIQEETQSAEHQFDVIVTADTENTLNEEAKACLHEGDTYFSNAGAKLEAWKIWYCLDNDENRFTWVNDNPYKTLYNSSNCTIKSDLVTNQSFKTPFKPAFSIYVDTNDVENNYDRWKNDFIYEFGYEIEPESNINNLCLYKSDADIFLKEEGSVDYNDKFFYRGTEIVDGVEYDKWQKYEEGCAGFLISGDGYIAFKAAYILTEKIVSGSIEIQNFYSTGVIYRMIDEWNNDCPYDFKNIMFKRYAITDITSQILNEEALLNLKNSLCFGNTSKRLGAKDAYNSLIPINNSNVSYSIDESNSSYYYTFQGMNSEDGETVSELYDMSTVKFKLSNEAIQSLIENSEGYNTMDYVTNNKINQLTEDFFCDGLYYTGKLRLNNIVFIGGLSYCIYNNEDEYWTSNVSSVYGNTLGVNNHTNTFGNICNYNTFGNNYYSNTFGNSCYNNTFGNSCYNNTFGNYCNYNTFGNYCNFNTFGNQCHNNTFGNSCRDNTFGNNCWYNTFGNGCYSNTFGNSCYSNTFGNICNYNTFGNNCYRNTFGNGCYSNTFGNYCRYNTFGNYCRYNTFGNGCYSNTFGNECWYNTFGNSCNSNTFGNECHNNTFGNECWYNTFGNGCNSNTFGNSCNYNTFGNYCWYNTFGNTYNTGWHYYKNFVLGDGTQYVIFKSTGTASANNCVQNYKTSQGLQGTSSSKLTVSLERNLSYENKIAKNSNGYVKIYCETDLIA